jgi:hypothetical protein
MLFFTRELFEGFQPDSGWERSATIKVNRNSKLYKKYFRLIRPFLPKSAIRFEQFGFHDSEVIERMWKDEKLFLLLDTAGTFLPLPKRYAHLTFTGVRRCPPQLPKKKEWWNWDEFHLGSRTKFSLHVMFTRSEIEIPADDIRLRFKND